MSASQSQIKLMQTFDHALHPETVAHELLALLAKTPAQDRVSGQQEQALAQSG